MPYLVNKKLSLVQVKKIAILSQALQTTVQIRPGSRRSAA